MQTNMLFALVLLVLLNEIIYFLLIFQGGTREVSILPLSPLVPPNPIKTTAQTPQGFANGVFVCSKNKLLFSELFNTEAKGSLV